MSPLRGVRETIGGIVSAGTVDIVAFGGSTIIALLTIIGETIELWVPFLSYLATVSDRIPWLDPGTIESAFILAVALLLVVYLIRIVRRTRAAINQNNDNA